MSAKSRPDSSTSTSRAPPTSTRAPSVSRTTPSPVAGIPIPITVAPSSRSSLRPSHLDSKNRATSTHSRPNTTTHASSSRDPLLDTDIGVGEGSDDDGDEVVRRIYERFRALGMPEQISLEDFARFMGWSSSGSVSGAAKSAASITRMPSARGGAGVSTTRGGQVARKQPHKEQQQQQQQQQADWKTALLFLSTHLVGRQEARKARGVISSARAELERAEAHRPASRVKPPSVSLSVSGGGQGQTNAKSDVSLNLLADPMARALQTRDMAYRSLDSARREWEVVSEGVRALDTQRKALTQRVAERRRVLLLLGVLERREGVRISRIGRGVEGTGSVGGVGTLVAELRKRSSLAMRAFEVLVMSPRPSPSSSLNERVAPNATGRQKLRDKVGRYKNTTDALAKLHAQHLSLVAHNTTATSESESGTGGRRRGKDSGKYENDEVKVARDGGVEARLQKVLRRLGLEGKALDKMKEKLKAVASRRASSSRPFGAYVGGRKEEDEQRLEALLHANEVKRAEVQMKINRAVGVGWLCEEYIELISTFRNETARDLGTMLDKERKRVVGYVDILRDSILRRREEQTPWADSVNDALGSSRVKVWEEVSERMEAVHKSETLTTGARGLNNKEEFEMREVTVNAEVMERKGRKADHGFALVEEMRMLLMDSRKLR